MSSFGPGTSEQEFKWKARVCWLAGDRSPVYTRNNSFPIEKQASFKEKLPYPGAIEYLLGALGGDIAAGFHAIAPRLRVEIGALEISFSAQLNNSLVLVQKRSPLFNSLKRSIKLNFSLVITV